MSESPGPKRLLRFSLRTLFVATAVLALIAALLRLSWQRTQTRREYLNNAGAVNGHVRTMQGYEARANKSTVSGILFGNPRVTRIWLYPETYDEDHREYIHKLFPEAIITDREQN